jgi:uncharacterized membrane protein YwaF
MDVKMDKFNNMSSFMIKIGHISFFVWFFILTFQIHERSGKSADTKAAKRWQRSLLSE